MSERVAELVAIEALLVAAQERLARTMLLFTQEPEGHGMTRSVIDADPLLTAGLKGLAAEPDVLRDALSRAIEGGYADASVDANLYHRDPVYHAVVWEARKHRELVGEGLRRQLQVECSVCRAPWTDDHDCRTDESDGVVTIDGSVWPWPGKTRLPWQVWNEVPHSDGMAIHDPDGFRGDRPTNVTWAEFDRARSACTLSRRERKDAPDRTLDSR